MNEKINKNGKVEKFTNMLGIAVRLIVIVPLGASSSVVVALSVCIHVYCVCGKQNFNLGHNF